MSEQAAPATTEAPATEGGEIQAQEQKTPAPKPAKKFIKVGDESFDEETLVRERQKWKGADQKFREIAQARQSIDSFYEALQNDPEAVLNDPRLPIKRRDLAMKWMKEQIQEELEEVDPRDVEAKELKAKLKRFEDQEAKQKQDEENSQKQRLTDSRKEAIAQTFTKALELTPLSKNEKIQAEVIAEMAKYMRLCKQAGHEVTPEELANHVSQNRMSAYQTLADSLDGDELISWLGEKIVHKLRKADLSRIQKSREAPAPDTAPADQWQPRGDGQKREFIDPRKLRQK